MSEQVDDSAVQNYEAIVAQAQTAMVNNRAFNASTPTNAQTVAQVKALGQQVNGIIRLLLQQLDGTN